MGERNFYKAYLASVDDLASEYGVNGVPLDLTVDLTPPKELFIEVRC